MRMIKCYSSTILTQFSCCTFSIASSEKQFFFYKSHADRGDNGKNVNGIALKNVSNNQLLLQWEGFKDRHLPSQSTCVCETLSVRLFLKAKFARKYE